MACVVTGTLVFGVPCVHVCVMCCVSLYRHRWSCVVLCLWCVVCVCYLFVVLGGVYVRVLLYVWFVPCVRGFQYWVCSCYIVVCVAFPLFISLLVCFVRIWRRDVIFQSIGSPMKFVRMGCVVFVVFRLCVLLYVEFGHFMVSLVWVVLGVLGRMVC